jgi:hypothetical protein
MKAGILAAVALALGLVLTWSGRPLTANPNAPDPDRVRTLVRQLDDSRFAAREGAERALRQMGLPAVPLLRAELKRPGSLEQIRRLERLVAELTRLPWHQDVQTAVSEAGKTGKPILAFSTIGTPQGFA